MEISLQERAERLARDSFLGGPVDVFEAIGRLQLITLLRLGLTPKSKVLDLGCGALRGGYWLINFLEPGGYCGIEPDVDRLATGRTHIVGNDLIAEKNARFSNNEEFDATEFNEKFDFWVARSIWTHASLDQIGQMLDGFVASTSQDAIFLSSYQRSRAGMGYRGDGWVGHSHESSTAGVISHAYADLDALCASRSLMLEELSVDRIRQRWLVAEKGDGLGPAHSYLRPLVYDERPSRDVRKSVRRLVARSARRLRR